MTRSAVVLLLYWGMWVGWLSLWSYAIFCAPSHNRRGKERRVQ